MVVVVANVNVIAIRLLVIVIEADTLPLEAPRNRHLVVTLPLEPTRIRPSADTLSLYPTPWKPPGTA